jgi:hypothetical protein
MSDYQLPKTECYQVLLNAEHLRVVLRVLPFSSAPLCPSVM